MIKIRYPSIMGDREKTMELAEGRNIADHEIRIGGLIAINRNSERVVIQKPEEILEEDEVLVFPRISGGKKLYNKSIIL